MTGITFWSVSFLKAGLHMHIVPQNRDKFTINNLSYYCKALIFTHPLVHEFQCGLIFMGHPVTDIAVTTHPTKQESTKLISFLGFP